MPRDPLVQPYKRAERAASLGRAQGAFNVECSTRSPTPSPSASTVPALSSSTALAGRRLEIVVSEKGTVFLYDGDDPSVRGDEQHVERQDRVAHPHGAHIFPLVGEEHALIVRHLPAEHQAGALLLRRSGHLDLEGMQGVARSDGERLPLLRGRRTHTAGERERDEKRLDQCDVGASSPSMRISAAISPLAP